jgi:acyl transferase domain-containing protein
VGSGEDDLLAGLDALAAGEPHPALVVSEGPVDAVPGRVAFVFDGSEPQTQSPPGAEFPALAAVGAEIAGVPGPDGQPPAGEGAMVGSGSFLTQAALARLLNDFGVQPRAVIGYPAGAAAAAPAPQSPPVHPDPGITAYVQLGSACVAHGTAAPAGPAVVRASIPGQPQALTLVLALARLHALGVTIAWAPLFVGQPAPRTVPLPTYTFQRQRYWLYDHVTQGKPAAGDVGADASFWRAVEHDDIADLAATVGAGPAEQDMLRLALPALAAWRRRRDCWYRVAWQLLPERAPRPGQGNWLIVSRPGERAAAVSAALRAHGVAAIPVEVAGAAAQAAKAVEQARAGTCVAGVLSLLAVDEEAPQFGPMAGLGLTVEMASSLNQPGAQVPLWIATQGAVVAGRDGPPFRPEQAQLWGLGQALAADRPDCPGGLVDLPARLDDRTGRWLAALLTAATGDREVAIRADGGHVRRLVRGQPWPVAPGRWQPAGTALLTGAATELGRSVARWLATVGFGHLLLAAADVPPDTLAAELAGTGARVSAVAADLADPDAIGRITAAVPAELPLTAAIHLNAWPASDPGSPDVGRIVREWPPEVAAMSGLRDLAAQHPLSALLVGLPSAGLMTGPGLGNQAPALAQVGGLASQCLTADGGPAVVVGLGVWGEPGGPAPMARHLRRYGMTPLSTGAALAALREAAESGLGLSVFADIDRDLAGEWLPGQYLNMHTDGDHHRERSGNGSGC